LRLSLVRVKSDKGFMSILFYNCLHDGAQQRNSANETKELKTNKNPGTQETIENN
jgi:hypothetical protein